MTQPRIGRVRDRFGLHRGVDSDPVEIADRQRSGLVRHRQALLDQRHRRLRAHFDAASRTSAIGHGRAADGSFLTRQWSKRDSNRRPPKRGIS
jgi:hypothetical protein